MILATWNCFSIPFTVAFEGDFNTHWTFDVFNSCIDFLFIADLIVAFRTTFQNSKTGDEVFSAKEIAVNYMKGRFWIDLLASLPLDFISMLFLTTDSNSWLFQVFGLLKLVRILRLSRLISFLNLK